MIYNPFEAIFKTYFIPFSFCVYQMTHKKDFMRKSYL